MDQKKKQRPLWSLTLPRLPERPKSALLGRFGGLGAGSSPGSLPVGLPALVPAPGRRVSERLGPPLDIRGVADLVGCSPWTVRQKLIPMGLPHFRSGASSKLIFYEDQVIRWIESKQKGG